MPKRQTIISMERRPSGTRVRIPELDALYARDRAAWRTEIIDYVRGLLDHLPPEVRELRIRLCDEPGPTVVRRRERGDA